MLGKTVTVKVISPLPVDGADIPLHRGTVNGYSQKGGAPQEAYVYGISSAVRQFTGTVAAILTREDGRECWIVAPRWYYLCEPELRRVLPADDLQSGTLRCHYEKSCGAVLFTEKDGVRHYLLVRNRSGYYGFPKGHMEGAETERETAVREIREETGLAQVTFLSPFREVSRYICRPYIRKQVVLFLAQFAPDAAIQPSFEIREYRLMPYAEALRRIGHRNDKSILKTAEEFLCVSGET